MRDLLQKYACYKCYNFMHKIIAVSFCAYFVQFMKLFFLYICYIFDITKLWERIIGILKGEVSYGRKEVFEMV